MVSVDPPVELGDVNQGNHLLRGQQAGQAGLDGWLRIYFDDLAG